jgi:excisionase family DNA binding protein
VQRKQTQQLKRTNASASSPVTLTRLKKAPDSKPRKNKRRALGGDKRKYYFVDEVADLTGTCERTIWRDIDDGRLIATYFRGSCRVADDDLKRYLRQQRGPRQLMKRRRSPRIETKARGKKKTS